MAGVTIFLGNKNENYWLAFGLGYLFSVLGNGRMVCRSSFFMAIGSISTPFDCGSGLRRWPIS